VTRAVDKPAIAGWLDANLALVAEFNAARKILTRQLQDASIDLAAFRDLHATAVELQTTTLLLRAVPPIPNETAAFEFAASLDAFEAALAEIARGAGELPGGDGGDGRSLRLVAAALGVSARPGSVGRS
jgi:hypothetical protein